MHKTYWCGEIWLKSQIVRLLFMNSSRNNEICLLKRMPKKKKGKRKTQIADTDNSYPNRYVVNLYYFIKLYVKI